MFKVFFLGELKIGFSTSKMYTGAKLERQTPKSQHITNMLFLSCFLFILFLVPQTSQSQ